MVVSFFSPVDGSSTERGPSTTSASASASNVTSWAQGPVALPQPQPQPQPTASPLPRPGDELCSGLLPLAPRQQQSDADAVLVPQPHTMTTKLRILPLPVTQPFVLDSILQRLSGAEWAGPEALSPVLLFKVRCTCLQSGSLVMFVRGQSVVKAWSWSPWSSSFRYCPLYPLCSF